MEELSLSEKIAEIVNAVNNNSPEPVILKTLLDVFNQGASIRVEEVFKIEAFRERVRKDVDNRIKKYYDNYAEEKIKEERERIWEELTEFACDDNDKVIADFDIKTKPKFLYTSIFKRKYDR